MFGLVTKKSFFKVKAGSSYSVPFAAEEQLNFVSILLAHWDFLHVPVSNGTVKPCQTFEHVFSLRTELRYEGSNVSCELLPTECASTTPPSMLREFQTATKGVGNFRYGSRGLHMTS